MSLPSARASHRHKHRESGANGPSQPAATPGTSSTNADKKERTVGLPVCSGEDNSVSGGGGSGKEDQDLLATSGPSSFWKRDPQRGSFFVDPSPSNHSCSGFDGYFVDTPRSSVVDCGGREEEEEGEQDASDEHDDDLIFDLES